MTIARKNIVDEETPGFYHCTNRCVRRSFLCGFDKFSKKDYSHRKDWLEQRIIELCDIFSVELFAFAVMSNHYHAVLYLDPQAPLNWTKEEVAEHWLKAYPGRLDNPEFAKQREFKKQAIIADKEKLKLYRKRLGSLSWFMSRLNEPLAKQSNQEDVCTGRFWEGRYSAQALLDEAAVFSAMAYVDLNPIRANLAETLNESNNTSIKRRIDSIKEKEPIDVQAYLNASVNAISNQMKSKKLPMSLKDYIELVEWTGKSIIHPNKHAMPSNIQSSLHRLNLQQAHWLKQIENFGKHYCHVVGPIELIKEKAKQLNQKWMKGIKAAKLLYEKPI
jgi:REP element-mobilizing transposase RayT